MIEFLEQVLSLLTTTPGSLAYHLVLAFSIGGALQASILYWRASGSPQGRRMALGLGLLLAVRLVLFALASLAWQGTLLPGVLPSVDRAVTLISLVIVTWLWAFPEPVRPADAANVLLALLAGVYLTLSLLQGGTGLNGSWLDVAGQAFALAILFLNGLALVVRKPNGWGMGLGMLGLLFAGHLAHLLSPLTGTDIPAVVRLAEIAAYPLLLAMPQRFAASADTLPVQISAPALASTSPATDPRLLPAILTLSGESDFDKVCQIITQTVAQVMVADLALLISAADKVDQIQLYCGYNLMRQEPVAGLTLAGRLVPSISNALRRNRPLRLPASSTSSDLIGLSQAIGTGQVGHMLSVPIQIPQGGAIFGIVLVSPYSGRGWTNEDQANLTSLAETFSQVLKQNYQHAQTSQELEKARQAALESQIQNQQIQHENEDLLSQLEATRQASSQERSRAESLAALVANQDGSPETMAQMEAELKRLRENAQASAVEPAVSPDVEHLEAELRLALEEAAHLKTLLSDTDHKIMELETHPGASPISDEQLTVVASISQELRQPMSSIVGYTDLLLGESVGILGALQRKFLERIKASIERMGALVDDLIQITVVENGRPELAPESVDLNSVMDEAIALTMPQLREKNILLRVDLSDHLPRIRADRDAVQQMLIHLVQNAGSASPQEGEISLHARVREENGAQDYVLLQVSDSGGGIAPEDLPRVFSRLYRTDNTAIRGLGDTGIGLSVVKSLVEAHGGRIWVDTETGRGSTFSVLLPISQSKASPNGKKGTQP